MAIYCYLWLCMTMYDYVWLCLTMQDNLNFFTWFKCSHFFILFNKPQLCLSLFTFVYLFLPLLKWLIYAQFCAWLITFIFYRITQKKGPVNFNFFPNAPSPNQYVGSASNNLLIIISLNFQNLRIIQMIHIVSKSSKKVQICLE